MNRNVWLLFCCQALMNAVMSGQTVMSALIGHALAVDKALNTLPMAIQMTATMTASIPAGIVFALAARSCRVRQRRACALSGLLLGPSEDGRPTCEASAPSVLRETQKCAYTEQSARCQFRAGEGVRQLRKRPRNLSPESNQSV